MTHRFHTQKWPEVVAFYEQLMNEHSWPIEPMLDLVRFMASSRYADVLFPCTSHDLLHIGRMADFSPGDNELQIKFDLRANRFKFTFVQRADDLKPWFCECPGSEWRVVLVRLLVRRLGWFQER